jgi:2,3-bisphosphoglycerate-dependent phosphoglycerate mutase
MPFLILARHGESTFNLENRFTWWIDVPLTDKGKEEARAIARKITGYRIDKAYSSSLQRTAESLRIVMKELHCENIPVVHSAELDERQYGDIQGLNKTETAARYGESLVHEWRRSYTVAPPCGESLKDASERILFFLDSSILQDVRSNMNVLVVAHGNTLRAIMKRLNHLNDREIMDLNIATGEVIVYKYNTSMLMTGKTTL